MFRVKKVNFKRVHEYSLFRGASTTAQYFSRLLIPTLLKFRFRNFVIQNYNENVLYKMDENTNRTNSQCFDRLICNMDFSTTLGLSTYIFPVFPTSGVLPFHQRQIMRVSTPLTSTKGSCESSSPNMSVPKYSADEWYRTILFVAYQNQIGFQDMKIRKFSFI